MTEQRTQPDGLFSESQAREWVKDALASSVKDAVSQVVRESREHQPPSGAYTKVARVVDEVARSGWKRLLAQLTALGIIIGGVVAWEEARVTARVEARMEIMDMVLERYCGVSTQEMLEP